MLTLVDPDDNIIGSINKLDGHLKKNVSQKDAYPHRAFSLFLFNSKNQLLLQKRSSKKITFPNHWTNTCCSHNSHEKDELENEPDFIGMRRAAIRRTKFELGIPDLDLNDLKVCNRILYYAESCGDFAEYELDYIIFAKKDINEHTFNSEEIETIKYVDLNEIDSFLEERKTKHNEEITPWFKIIMENKLKKWWKDLIDNNTFPNESSKIEKFI
jgi:isopentenyl-diphosphate delta-isomerase